MSYNITRTITISSTLRLPREHWEKAEAIEAPDDSFVERLCESSFVDSYAPIKDFAFRGEFSGTAYNNGALASLVALLQGDAEVIFVWESGDYVSSIRIKDGVMTECDVGYVLREKKS